MDRFRYLNTKDIDNRTAEELQAMLNVAYGDLAGYEQNTIDRVRCLRGIRKITGALASLTMAQAYRVRPELVI